ncbi:hypothetical protein B0H15DRAFT_950594 [Mycena belliarum]|uniref:Uncharacterized protein n=1 Tax=Mycena belliarum TaxID=1033014 RepID=A0AAD6XN05_9AGAR|nr:hypothetical protein B0H15DRAFT_950594 [Mycena belliae]
MSASYWASYHRSRAAAKARADPNYFNYNDLGALQAQPPIYTFVPQHAAPVVTIVQNDGSLVTHPPRGPRHGPSKKTISHDPATLGLKSHRRHCAAIAARARARLELRPDPDTLLLARLAQCPTLKAAREGKSGSHTGCTASQSTAAAAKGHEVGK